MGGLGAKLVSVVGIAGLVVVSTVGAKEMGPTTTATLGGTNAAGTTPARLLVSMGVARNGDTVSYSVTLDNPGGGDVKDVFLAANIAPGTTFMDGGPNAAKEGFQGVQSSAAVWLSNGVPAFGRAGPFTYRVKLTGDTAEPVRAWVHWRSPAEGTGISSPVKVLPSLTVATLASGPAGALPQIPLVWTANTAVFPVQGTVPNAGVTLARVFYNFEGVSTVSKGGVTVAYGPGSAGYLAADGAPWVNGNPTDRPAWRWVFFPVPASATPGANLVFQSDELTGLKNVPYTIGLFQIGRAHV